MCHRFSILLLLLLLAGCAREKVDRIEWTVMGTVAAAQEALGKIREARKAGDKAVTG